MRIKLATLLIGEFPRYVDVKLPDNAAVVNVAHSPIAVDAYRRIYWSGDSRMSILKV